MLIADALPMNHNFVFFDRQYLLIFFVWLEETVEVWNKGNTNIRKVLSADASRGVGDQWDPINAMC